jgi:hypothetical protein
VSAHIPKHIQDDLDLDDLIQLASFRRFVGRVFESAHVLATTHSANAQTSALAEGRRSLALEILDMLTQRQPDALIRVLQENLKAQPQEQQHGRRSRDDSSTDE